MSENFGWPMVSKPAMGCKKLTRCQQSTQESMDPTLSVEGKKPSGQSLLTGCPKPPNYHPKPRLHAWAQRNESQSVGILMQYGIIHCCYIIIDWVGQYRYTRGISTCPSLLPHISSSAPIVLSWQWFTPSHTWLADKHLCDPPLTGHMKSFPERHGIGTVTK